jgi:S1-C subfamily serine protease
MSTELLELSDALAQATDRAARGVVAVHTEARGSSSGIVWRPTVIVTAEHALRRDEDIQVTLADGRIALAELAGRDSAMDLAVLKCAEATGALQEYCDVASLKPGSLTLVVGLTRASGPVAALSVVSLVAPERHTWTGASLAPYIRLDVELQPTAVGGVVIDAHGRAAGLATPRFARFGAIAIPAPTVSATVETLLTKGRIPRGYLGVGLQSVRLPDSLRQLLQRTEMFGAIVLEVESNGPAHKGVLGISQKSGSCWPSPSSGAAELVLSGAIEGAGTHNLGPQQFNRCGTA